MALSLSGRWYTKPSPCPLIKSGGGDLVSDGPYPLIRVGEEKKKETELVYISSPLLSD